MMLLQYIVNGLLYGATLTLPAIGLTLIFAALRFPTFAIAAHLAVGAYAGYVSNALFGLPIAVGFVAAFAVAGLVGVLTDEIAVKPLKGRGSLAIAIVTIALTIILENILRFGFGNQFLGFDLPLYRDASIGGVRIGVQQAINLAAAILVTFLVFAFLTFTQTGKALRAVADNTSLAALRGINTDKVRRLAVFVGMGLAGLGGMLIGVETSVDPLLGTRMLLPVFAAAILGGLGNIFGAVAGALLIGVISEVALLAIDPSYRSAISFFVLLVVLSLRPQGLFGDKFALRG